jgi:hypothetical protein
MEFLNVFTFLLLYNNINNKTYSISLCDAIKQCTDTEAMAMPMCLCVCTCEICEAGKAKLKANYNAIRSLKQNETQRVLDLVVLTPYFHSWSQHSRRSLQKMFYRFFIAL